MCARLNKKVYTKNEKTTRHPFAEKMEKMADEYYYRSRKVIAHENW